ncbi:MAG TPA: MFS transporter, partial [Candidatus Saccharimonadales bacterium]|nr:MFS transporter [Candidatus Saccharimonadales bacterium]
MPNPNKNHRYAALAAATLLLALNFWAWSLISPLATSYKHIFGLSPLAVSALVAAPVLIGSLGRIPLGMLTDRYGGRRMLTAVCWLAGMSAGGLALAGSYSSVLAAAFCLGIAGAAFAVGVPFVNSWFSRRQRGFALGIYAMG